MNTIGVDNGISGALVHMDSRGSIIAQLPMPTVKTRKGNEIDVPEVWRWLKVQTFGVECRVIIEEPSGSKSYKAAVSMAASFHAVRAVIEIMGLSLRRITPSEWQKPLLKAKTGDTKMVAAQMVKSLWPQHDFRASERCRTMDSGLVDAALICEWARRQHE